MRQVQGSPGTPTMPPFAMPSKQPRLPLQAEVEQHYADLGYLLPSFHQGYWLGYHNPSKDGTTWQWVDHTLASLNGTTAPASAGSASPSTSSSYTHWGTPQQSSSSTSRAAEPNNAAGDEFCALASFPLAYGPPPRPVAAGWADTTCSQPHLAMCRLLPSTTYSFTSGSSGTVYLLRTEAVQFQAAEQYCNDAGGHVVSYSSAAEQREVEGFFTAAGKFVCWGHVTPMTAA
jgi:hypothetical protein